MPLATATSTRRKCIDTFVNCCRSAITVSHMTATAVRVAFFFFASWCRRHLLLLSTLSSFSHICVCRSAVCCCSSALRVNYLPLVSSGRLMWQSHSYPRQLLAINYTYYVNTSCCFSILLFLLCGIMLFL